MLISCLKIKNINFNLGGALDNRPIHNDISTNNTK